METIIERVSFVPYYHQLKEILRRAIETEQIKPGENIPPERELGERYKISRITVRKAIEQLIYEGMLYREQGRGTFVSRSRIIHPMKILSFTEDMQQRGFKPGTKILETKIISGDKEISQCLAINANEEIAMISRIRLANNEPIAIETSYLPHRLYPNILQEDLTGSFIRLTEQKYHLRLAKATQVIDVSLPSEQEKKILKINEGVPVFLVKRASYLENNQTVEFLKAVYRGDRYKFTMHLVGR